MQVALDRFGRMVLPKAIRDDLGLQPGAALDVEEQAHCIVLRPVRQQAAVREKDGLLVYSGIARSSITGAVTDERNQRMRHVSGMDAKQ